MAFACMTQATVGFGFSGLWRDPWALYIACTGLPIGHLHDLSLSAATDATLNLLDNDHAAITYSKDAAAALQGLLMAQSATSVPRLLFFQEQAHQRDDPPPPIPICVLDGKAYNCYWHKGNPLYVRAGIHVHLVHHLSFARRLSVYEVALDGWQLNIIHAHVPFGDATEHFLRALAEACCQMTMLVRTIIIGNMIAAPTPADRRG